jgi:hypothetical protein
MAALSKGFSMFSSAASSFASSAVSAAETVGKRVNESVIEPGTRAVRDPEFSNNASTQLQNVGSMFSSFGAKVCYVSLIKAFTGMSGLVQKGEWDTGKEEGNNEWDRDQRGGDDWNTAPEVKNDEYQYHQPTADDKPFDDWNSGATKEGGSDDWNAASGKDDGKAADWDSEWTEQPTASAPVKDVGEKKEDSWDKW